MNIELELRSLKDELSKSSLFDMSIDKLLSLKKNIDKYFSDHPFNPEKISPNKTKYFNTIKLYEHKEKVFSIYMVDENPELTRENGRRKIIPDHNKINSPAFLIEYENLEIKLKPIKTKENKENFKIAIFVNQENKLKNYLFLNDEVKSVIFDYKSKNVKKMISFRIKKEEWVSAIFSNSYYKNLKYFNKRKQEIGFGIVEYSVVRHYYELKFHPIAFYFKGKVREYLDCNKIEIAKKNKMPIIPFRFNTIIEHLKENIPEKAFKENMVFFKDSGVNKIILDEIFTLAELKYTN